MKVNIAKWPKRAVAAILAVLLAITFLPFSQLNITKAEEGPNSLSAETERYQATVSFGDDAGIPEGAYLVLTEFEEDSDEFATAREAIINEDNGLNEDNLGMAAFDLTIYDAEGNIFEPLAPVQVNIQMKALPDGVDLEVLEDTLSVQHLDESTGETDVETVATTNEDEVGAIVFDEDAAEAEFTVDSFSTFTITWSNNTTNTTTSLRLRAQGNNGNQYNNTVGAVVFNYVTSSGASITRPNGVVGNTDINVSYRTSSFSNHEVIISSDNVVGTYSDRTYERAYIIDGGEQKEITRILFSRVNNGYGNNTWTTAYYNGDTLVATATGNTVTGDDWRIPVYLQYTGDAPTSEVTLHFVDRDGNELSGFKYGDTTLSDTATFTMAELLPNNGDTLDLTTAFTKEGYTFANSFINYHNGTASDGVVIGNMLRRNNNVMQYKTLPGSSATNGYTDLTDGKDIYLVFDPTSGSGGGGGEGGDDETPDLGTIGNSKSVASNGDGTYKVSLSVSGTSQHKTEETDINVIFVIDCSNSMTMNGRTRLADTKVAVKNMANQLLKNNTTANPDAIELALVAFNASAWTVSLGSSNWTSDYNTFANAVGTGNNSGITSASGTNWEEALQHAISVDKGDGDLTYVIFFTDGDPTEYAGHRNVDSTYVNNYWPARDEARKLVNDGKTLYGIFAYGDNGTHYLDPLVSYAYNGSSSGHYYNATDTTAVNAALSEILDTINMNFAYANVEIDDGVTGLSSTPLKGADTSSLTYKITYRDYTSTTAYTTKTITTTENSDGYKLTVNSDGTVTIPAVTYHVLGRDANNNPAVETVTTSAVTIKGAAFTDNGDAGKSVDWDMKKANGTGDAAIYMLENGWTYTIEFDVWPSQAAYDLVAALNNGVIEWGDDFVYTDADGNTVTVPFNDYKSQVNAGTPYTLKTNTNCTVKYQQVKATTDSDGNTTYEYGEVKEVPVVADPEGKMGLASTTMNVQKAWKDTINTRNRANYVDFYLKIDGKYYHKDGTESTDVPSDSDAYIIPVTDTGKYSDGTTTYSAGAAAWINSVYIAPGVMTTEGGIEVLETGHYYTILEKSAHSYERDSNKNPIVGSEDSYQSYSMDFTSQTVRPMVVDGTLEYLVLVDSDNPVPSGAKTYKIGTENYYVATGGAAGLTATNNKTAELDITKAIDSSLSTKTKAELNAETFTYDVEFTVPEDGDTSGINYWIYEADDSESAWPLPEYDSTGLGADYAPFGHEDGTKYSGAKESTTVSGQKVTATVTIKRGQVVRFTNLPKGTTYKIVETKANNQTLSAQGYTVDSVESTNGTVGKTTIDKDTITGTIAAYDTRYYNQFTNKLEAVDAELKVTKVLDGYAWADGDSSYEFTLTATGNAPLPYKNASTNNKVTVSSANEPKSFGLIRFTAAGEYEYTITETKGNNTNIVYGDPVKVTVKVEQVDGKFVVTSITGGTATTFTEASTGENATPASSNTTITNKLAGRDLTVTKTFSGIDALPSAFKIAVAYTDATGPKTAVLKTTDEKVTISEDGKTYTWTIEKVMPNKTVTAEEKDYGVDGYAVATGVTVDGVAAPSATKAEFLMPNSDGTTVAFTNNYANVTIDTEEEFFKKNVTTPNAVKDATFNFSAVQVDEDGKVIPGGWNKTGSVTYTAGESGERNVDFKSITYTEAGTYYYKITETSLPKGWTATPASKTATVTVVVTGSAADEDGLTAEVTEASISNAYTPTPITATIPVKKEFVAPEGFAGSIKNRYTFTLAAVSNNAGAGVETPMPEVISYTNPDDDGGVVTFGDDKFKFTKAGTYTYKVTESGTVDGVTNDAAAATGKTVTVTVTDDGEGTLSATVSPTAANPLTFTNTLELGTLEITKDLTVYNDFVNSTTTAIPDNVTFTFEIVATWNGTQVYRDYEALTFANAQASTITIANKLPIGSKVTIKEVYPGAGYKPEGNDTVTIDKMTTTATAAFKNAYNNKIIGGYGIENHFINGEYQDPEQALR